MGFTTARCNTGFGSEAYFNLMIVQQLPAGM
jgi:hypothetical protein